MLSVQKVQIGDADRPPASGSAENAVDFSATQFDRPICWAVSRQDDLPDNLSQLRDREFQAERQTAHIWDMVTNEVYRPIGILHAPTMHTVERDGSRGIPLLGFGLTPTIDDVAKLVSVLQARGQYHGRQILSASKLDEALRRKKTGVNLG